MTDTPVNQPENPKVENPMGTDGFEFVEYAAPDPQMLRTLFEKLGFPVIGTHKTRDITLHRQGDINFIINAEKTGFAADFAKKHGPCACSMGFRVANADQAFERAVRLDATPITDDDRILSKPAIEGIGGSRLYLVDGYGGTNAWIEDYDILPDAEDRMKQWGAGLTYIDHLTHNVIWGNMDKWRDFYGRLFNFGQVRYFDIKGKLTGLVSRALASPCGKIRIPLNESEDDKSQINEYLDEYKGEGIQHIALGTGNIYQSVDILRDHDVAFQDTPDTYYERLDARLPDHGEPVAELQKRRILVDGGEAQGGGMLLQIFTKNVIGPIFYEIIQRKGNEGFGEGNFKALFESIEQDQIRRGYLTSNEAAE
ncbi:MULTISPECIES: 4-hydroxyphenylpyruvate dioxygenase [Iodidimonas]|jgi:4-hydroxyphenylpyruvate dioxygenase|uniref:4-hydroxyphenylpyruvate dioxygenase n=1 Tax=Iodidimonas nitroreducens TaxID=1236968 RepID=A0A5A7N3V6_9PROT|nr:MULTISPECIES: 4-hydroxyphenylpyruvate dioxygenase [Iodidimonas]GAK34347.1 hemolysin VllY [alpha proteobacterium Q-1]GER02818.1 4-hydroxyphenylpyruvate dioxygenase [Iodidimonas nitroreducens]